MSPTSQPNGHTKDQGTPSAKGYPVCGSCGTELPELTNASDSTFAAATSTKVPMIADLWAPWWAMPNGRTHP